MTVEQHQEGAAEDGLAARSPVGDQLAVEQHAQGLTLLVAPVLVGHLLAVTAEPGDVLAVHSATDLTLEETLPAEDRLTGAQLDEAAGEVE